MAQELQQPQQTALGENGAHHMDAMTLVGQAVANGAQVEQVDKLIELVKFNDDREALRAFNRAFTDAQKEFPNVKKTKQAHNSKYAPLDEEVRQMKPVLSAHGFSFRHEVSENDNNSITVRCILAHRDGHSESATLTGPADNSGKKNSIQAIGSSVTYLRRYTFEAVTGLVTTDQDDDAQTANQPASVEKITEEQANQIYAALDEMGKTKDKFINAFRINASAPNIKMIEDIPASGFQAAMQMIQNQRKREAQNG